MEKKCEDYFDAYIRVVHLQKRVPSDDPGWSRPETVGKKLFVNNVQVDPAESEFIERCLKEHPLKFNRERISLESKEI